MISRRGLLRSSFMVGRLAILSQMLTSVGQYAPLLQRVVSEPADDDAANQVVNVIEFDITPGQDRLFALPISALQENWIGPRVVQVMGQYALNDTFAWADLSGEQYVLTGEDNLAVKVVEDVMQQIVRLRVAFVGN